MRDVAAIASESCGRSDYGDIGQCGVSALSIGASIGGGTGPYIGFFAELLTELEFD